MNPARSLGPAIVAGFWENHWVRRPPPPDQSPSIASRDEVLSQTRPPLLCLQVYWFGPVVGAMLAGVSHDFLFARSASRQKLVACLSCKDIEMVETASMTGSSLSTVTQNAMRAKQASKADTN